MISFGFSSAIDLVNHKVLLFEWKSICVDDVYSIMLRKNSKQHKLSSGCGRCFYFLQLLYSYLDLPKGSVCRHFRFLFFLRFVFEVIWGMKSLHRDFMLTIIPSLNLQHLPLRGQRAYEAGYETKSCQN